MGIEYGFRDFLFGFTGAVVVRQDGGQCLRLFRAISEKLSLWGGRRIRRTQLEESVSRLLSLSRLWFSLVVGSRDFGKHRACAITVTSGAGSPGCCFCWS